MPTIKVVNLKCGGCREQVKRDLERLGMKEVDVNVEKQTVSFDGDVILAEKRLSELGYPKKDSPEAKSLLKKGKSYLSCMLGRAKK